MSKNKFFSGDLVRFCLDDAIKGVSGFKNLYHGMGIVLSDLSLNKYIVYWTSTHKMREECALYLKLVRRNEIV